MWNMQNVIFFFFGTLLLETINSGNNSYDIIFSVGVLNYISKIYVCTYYYVHYIKHMDLNQILIIWLKYTSKVFTPLSVMAGRFHHYAKTGARVIILCYINIMAISLIIVIGIKSAFRCRNFYNMHFHKNPSSRVV